MIDVALGVILNLLALAAIGIGPALIFLSSEKRLEVALAIAPALGFALSSVVGTYLILLDKPVTEWAIPWLVISVVLSTALSFLAFKKYQLNLASINWQLVIFFAVGLGLTTLLVLLPMVLGGTDFTTLRGNGTDTFNYIALAGYLDHEPYSWASQVDVQTLSERHPSYPLAKILLSTRWTTSAMLALTSRIVGLPIYQFEYGFTVFCFILAVGPAFWLALSTKIKPLYALLLSVAIAVGFWGQFVLDIRSISHINSIPIVLLLGLLISRIETNRKFIFTRESILLPIVFVSLILFYVEIVPMVVLGLAIFWAKRIKQRVTSISHFKLYLPSLCLIILVLVPLLHFLLSFLKEQLQVTSTNPNDYKWKQAFFTWFYQSPINGLWGLPYIEVDKALRISLLTNIVNLALTSIAVILLLVLTHNIIKLFIRKGEPEATLLSTSWALASLIQFFVLLLRQQFWAAGKGLSFGYPYFMISIVAFTCTSSSLRNFKFSVFLSKFIKFAVIAWLVIQFSLGFYRISFAFKIPEYANYIGHHGEYRGHDWNTKPFNIILSKQHGLTVGLVISNQWVAEYFSFAFGWNTHLVNFFDVRKHPKMKQSNVLKQQQALTQFPDYIIAEKKLWDHINNLDAKIVTQNSELLLVKTPKYFWEKPILLALENPNSIEVNPQGNRWFWMSREPTHLTLFSPINGEVSLSAQFVMGPSLPEQSERHVVVISTSDDKPHKISISKNTKEITVPVREGINKVTLQVLDKQTLKILPNGDSRTLLLGVYGLQLRLSKADR